VGEDETLVSSPGRVRQSRAKSKELKFFLTPPNGVVGEDETLVSSPGRVRQSRAKGEDETLVSSPKRNKVRKYNLILKLLLEKQKFYQTLNQCIEALPFFEERFVFPEPNRVL